MWTTKPLTPRCCSCGALEIEISSLRVPGSPDETRSFEDQDKMKHVDGMLEGNDPVESQQLRGEGNPMYGSSDLVRIMSEISDNMGASPTIAQTNH